MSDLKLISIGQNSYGDDGIEVEVQKDGKNYKAVLQLPNCADSQHCFVDGTEDEELLSEIVRFLERKYTQTELNLLSYVGYVSKYETFTHNRFEYYVIIDDDKTFPIFKESAYSNYYNKILFEKIDWNDFDEDDRKEIEIKIKQITDKYNTKD